MAPLEGRHGGHGDGGVRKGRALEGWLVVVVFRASLYVRLSSISMMTIGGIVCGRRLDV